MSAEEGTEHYLLCSEYMTNLIIANAETLSHDDSYTRTLTAFLQTVISLGGAWPLALG